MIRYPADETTPITRLKLFVELVEIYDTDGKFLGLFVPANLERGKKLYAEAASHFDPAELDRIEAAGKIGRTTQEVLARLVASSPVSLADSSANGTVEKAQSVSP